MQVRVVDMPCRRCMSTRRLKPGALRPHGQLLWAAGDVSPLGVIVWPHTPTLLLPGDNASADVSITIVFQPPPIRNTKCTSPECTPKISMTLN